MVTTGSSRYKWIPSAMTPARSRRHYAPRKAGVTANPHAPVQVRFCLQVLYPVTVSEAVNRCDKQVMAKRDELRAFERTFTAAQVLLHVV